jgi:hypothetical protein
MSAAVSVAGCHDSERMEDPNATLRYPDRVLVFSDQVLTGAHCWNNEKTLSLHELLEAACRRRIGRTEGSCVCCSGEMVH